MKRLTGRIVPLISMLLALGWLAPECAAQAFKIGVFDPQRVSEETDVGRQVQADISAFREQKQAEINAKQDQLAELEKQLSQQALSLSADRRARMEKDIQRLRLEVQSLSESAGRELQLELAEASDQFQAKLLAVVESFGRDEGFSLILERSLVAWSTDSIDVTSAIVDRFDRMFPGSDRGAEGAGSAR